MASREHGRKGEASVGQVKVTKGSTRRRGTSTKAKLFQEKEV